MQLIGRCVFLAVCFLSVYSLPQLGLNQAPLTNDGLYQIVVAQLRSSLIDTRVMTPAETACANLYNQNTTNINNRLANNTNVCFENANKTRQLNHQSANATANIVRADLIAVQNNMSLCLNQTDLALLFKCTIDSFDSNLFLENHATATSFTTLGAMNANLTMVDITRESCVSAAVNGAKANLTIAANEYTLCLNSVQKQRGAPLTGLLQN